MIEEVNNKLREQIDINARKEREQLVLNTKLLDIPQLTKQAQKSEEAKKKLETQMLDINLKCEQLEKINNSFTDKQLETQQKLENIRKEKLNLIKARDNVEKHKELNAYEVKVFRQLREKYDLSIEKNEMSSNQKNETELTNNAKITLERIKKGDKFQV